MEESQIISLKDVDSASKAPNSQEQFFLKSINLSVNTGETVAILGRNDSGKSSLLRCIALLDRPLTGIVSIDNKNLTFMASRELCNARRNIGYVNGNPTLLATKDALHNVALALQIQGYSKTEAQKLANLTLTKVGLDHKANALPNQLNALQILQLDLARAIINAPKILLCDEVFANLDQKSTDFFCNLLQNLKKELKLTIILTTNDATLIKNYCASVIVMQQGAIVERCSVLNLFTQPQSDVAKEFIRLAAKHELPGSIRKKIQPNVLPQHHALVRINFQECIAPEEILSNALDAFDLHMNIIQAYQDPMGDTVVNLMVIEIFGAHDIVQEAINFLSNNGLHSEIIGYVPNLN